MDKGKIFLQFFLCVYVVVELELKSWNSFQMSSIMGVKSLNPSSQSVISPTRSHNFGIKRPFYLLRRVGKGPWPACGFGGWLWFNTAFLAVLGLLTERTTVSQECENGHFEQSFLL